MSAITRFRCPPDGDPAVLTDMVWKEVVVEIPNLKPEDTITIMGKTNEAKAGKGRFLHRRCVDREEIAAVAR